MCKFFLLLIAVSLVLGCVDRTPTNRGSAFPSQGSVSTKRATAISDSVPEILSRAITAFGGERARKKLRNCKITTRCVVAIPAAVREAGSNTASIEDCFCYPDKWRRTVRPGPNGAEYMLFVVTGNHHWAKPAGKKVQEMPLPPLNMRKPALLATLDQLTGLRESKEETIIEAEEEVAGRTLVPLTILASGQPRSTTYFDRSTNLIAKETKYYLPDVLAQPETWKKRGPVETETEYDNYKNFDGVMVPTRVVVSQAGKTVFDACVLDVEFPAKFDAHLFDKPEDE
jgi:hypothetical protein